ncbi:MAG: Rrf2 family transcriptional regulator, partial [Phycisphaerales bacterium]|nr:Rrf2 family transcriptional regulator [Phycisphaerales bacterium]
ALRAVVHLARIGGGPAAASIIADATSVPAGYLAHVLRSLSKAGMLTAQRGTGGGFTLARPAGQINVWEVLVASDAGIGRIESCPLKSGGHGTSLCPLHACLDKAIAQVEAIFRQTSIQDLLNATPGAGPLCQVDASVRLRLDPTQS